MRIRRRPRRLTLAVLFVACLASCVAIDGTRVGWRTLGGKQFWTDVRWDTGWRIQRHAWTGHHRLLDPNDVRWTAGSLARCTRGLEAREEAEFEPPEHVVICVHGLGRSRGSFDGMLRALRDEGFAAVAFGYASTRGSLERHADDLAEFVAALPGSPRVSFVTHSLGGIVVRELLAREDSRTLELGRLVQLGPPNRRPQLAVIATAAGPLAWLLGPAARQLAAGEQEALPAPPLPTRVIAGTGGRTDGYNPLIDGDDDGVVGVTETRLAGSDALEVRGFHTLLMDTPDARTAVIDFLRPAL